MLASSSPTISAPPSPSTAFHSAARSSYHASHASPRFTLTTANSAARRLDAQHTHTHPHSHPHPRPAFATPPAPAPSAATTASPAPSPSSAPAASPYACNALKRPHPYADAATQYTPPGFPPTYRPANTAAPASAPLDAPAIVDPLPAGGDADSAPAVAPPAEPSLRQIPRPVDHGPPPPQRTPHERPSASASASASTSASASASGPAPVPAPGTVDQDDDEATSSAKRARPLDPALKVMPLKYETCNIKDLGVLVSDMLMELVRLNDGHPLHDGQLTRFHSRAPPGISVRDYLLRLIVHATLSPPILLSMVFYVDKLCTMYPSFTISSLTVHRFLITAATVAAKGLSDSFWTNTLYARVGGVSVRELALLELEFLRKLEWRIVPKPEVLVDYYKGLVERAQGYTMESQPDASPTASEERVQSPAGSATGIHTSQ